METSKISIITIKIELMKKTIVVSLLSFILFVFNICFVKAFEDNTAPTITAFSITPSEINTSNGDQSIVITISVSDDGVGICQNSPSDSSCSSDYNANRSYISVKLEPLIGTQYVEAYSPSYVVDFTRISGDDHNGVYRATKTIPYGSKSGIWGLASVWVQDKLGNQKQWNNNNGNDISSIPNATGLTIANTAESSSVKIEKEWTFSSSMASVTFPVNTTVTKKEGGSFAFYKMVNQDFSLNSLTSSGLSTGSDVVGRLKIGIPGLGLSFDKPVTIKINVDSKYNGQTLNIQALGESDSAWANETTCTVSSGQCSFTVNHATYFVASVKTTSSTSGNVQVTTDTSTLTYSISKQAKTRISYTFTNLSLTNKKYVTMRLGGRKVKVVGLRRSGTSSIVTVELKYAKWGRGNYNLAMSYKNKTKTAYKDKKGRTKYRKGWERGNVSQNDILSIN
ncbi:MAG: hypothetical protein NTU76_01070 [Candidatus Taylorbacteria bacterium]|nr:hypothetical protein [Candidatus Taylorbacteria bacterium]